MNKSRHFDEITLLAQLRQGDRDAFIRLYDHYHPALYHYVLRLIKVPELAEDVMQDVFLKIWEIRERVNPELSFNAYLYRISRNKVFKLLKKMASDEGLYLRALMTFAGAVEDADNKIRWQQYETLLNTAVSLLSPQRQKVFRLCRDQGLSYEQVSHQLGISRNTVKEHMVLAVRHIKEYCIHYGDFFPLVFFMFC